MKSRVRAETHENQLLRGRGEVFPLVGIAGLPASGEVHPVIGGNCLCVDVRLLDGTHDQLRRVPLGRPNEWWKFVYLLRLK